MNSTFLVATLTRKMVSLLTSRLHVLSTTTTTTTTTKGNMRAFKLVAFTVD